MCCDRAHARRRPRRPVKSCRSRAWQLTSLRRRVGISAHRWDVGSDMRKLNYYDSDDRERMEVSAYDQQLFDEAGWAPVAAELADALRDDEAKMAALLEAVRKVLDNGMRQVGIEDLL